jgi:hypothetical protein
LEHPLALAKEGVNYFINSVEHIMAVANLLRNRERISGFWGVIDSTLIFNIAI